MAKKSGKLGAILAAIAILVALGIGIIEATGLLDITEYGGIVTTVLVVFGLILGLVNIKKGESVPFMVAALVIAGGATALAVLPYVGEWVQILFSRIATLVIPAAIVVAIGVAYQKISK
jgi:peptidoglycan/LPS O-acetylase OafA/YrhL